VSVNTSEGLGDLKNLPPATAVAARGGEKGLPGRKQEGEPQHCRLRGSGGQRGGPQVEGYQPRAFKKEEVADSMVAHHSPHTPFGVKRAS